MVASERKRGFRTHIPLRELSGPAYYQVKKIIEDLKFNQK